MGDDASLFIRLYLDEDVHKRVAVALRLRHFDVISAHEIDRLGADDDVQLQFAAENDRALLTFNTTHLKLSTSARLLNRPTLKGKCFTPKISRRVSLRKSLGVKQWLTAFA